MKRSRYILRKPVSALAVLSLQAAALLSVATAGAGDDVLDDIGRSNTIRRWQATIFSVFQWVILAVALSLLIAATSICQVWLIPLFSKTSKASRIWAVIDAVVAVVAFLIGGLVAWISVGTLLVLVIIVALVLHFVVKRRSHERRRRNIDIESIESKRGKRSPRDADEQKPRFPDPIARSNLMMTSALAGASALLIVLFLILMMVFPIRHHHVWHRSTNEASKEFAPRLVTNALALLYGVPRWFSWLRIDSILMLQSTKCGERFSVKLDTDKQKRETIYKNFIERYDINMTLFKPSDYRKYSTVNQWFSRSIRPEFRPVSTDHEIVSVADSRVVVIPRVTTDAKMWLKTKEFTMAQLIRSDLASTSKNASNAFKDGAAVIFRLAPQDYHRYHSPISGTVIDQWSIDGPLMSVSEIAMRSCNGAIYNKRTVTLMRDAHGRQIGFVAIGATCVGSVIMTAGVGDQVTRGQDIGTFQFGGSTVVLLVPNGAAVFPSSLLKASKKGVEALIEQGSAIAHWRNPAIPEASTTV